MNNKILGIVGSALLIVGIFLPIVSLMGFGISYFDGIKAAPAQAITGVGVCLMGVVGLILALTNKYRMLILPGIIALGILILDFFRLKSSFSATAAGEEMPPELASAVSIGWGMYVMIIGAIILIIAGVMKSAAPTINPGWGAPPPPPPYPPAR